MIINLDHLRAGLDWWVKNDWEKDIINTDYVAIYKVRCGGVTEEWWTATVDRLSKWGVIRPYPKDKILANGKLRLSDIKCEYLKLMKEPTEPSIADLCWKDAAPFFKLASGIKPVKNKSPAFPSKMCHLLFPKLFILMDNKATGIIDYGVWWQSMREEWCGFKAKEEAIKILRTAAGSHLHPLYPVETKIMEISQIGVNHKSA